MRTVVAVARQDCSHPLQQQGSKHELIFDEIELIVFSGAAHDQYAR